MNNNVVVTSLNLSRNDRTIRILTNFFLQKPYCTLFCFMWVIYNEAIDRELSKYKKYFSDVQCAWNWVWPTCLERQNKCVFVSTSRSFILHKSTVSWVSQKKYTNLKSYIFVLRTDKSLTFVRQDKTST